MAYFISRKRLASVAMLISFGLTLLVVATAHAADDDIDYVPPAKDAPGKRLGGASRNERGQQVPVVIHMLAPRDRVGQTVQPSPVLYWYLSATTKAPVDIVISPIDPTNPTKLVTKPAVLDIRTSGEKKAGLQRLDLSKADDGKPVKLEAGKQYEWKIEVVEKETAGSANPKASCRLECVAPAGDVAALVSETNHAKRASGLARAGIWYDAIAALNDLIEEKKSDPAAAAKLIESRRKLLKAQGLIEDDKGNLTEVNPTTSPK